MRPVAVSLQGVLDQDCATTVQRARYVAEATDVQGFEVFVPPRFFNEYAHRKREILSFFRGYRVMTLHMHTAKLDDEASYLARIRSLIKDFKDNGLPMDGVVFHPGDYELMHKVEELSDLGVFVGAEVMGRESPRGLLMDEFEALFQAHPGLSMTLDTAHVMETNQDGGPGLLDFALRFKDRVRHVHMSWAGNLYPPERMGRDFLTYHSLMHLAPEPVRELGETIKDLGQAVLTLEGVVPSGPWGQRLLASEMDFVRSLISENGAKPRGGENGS